MKANALIFGMLISGAIGFFLGCTTVNQPDTQTEQKLAATQQELTNTQEQIKKLAAKVGLPSNKIEQSSTLELLTDIEIALRNDDNYYFGKELSEYEIKLLSDYLASDQKTLETIKKYHQYIKNIRGKRVIVLPQE